MSFRLTSPSFVHEHPIPRRHTCDGDDVSPALVWTAPPKGTKSFALIVDDPDAPDPRAPRRTWVHWVLYGLPPDLDALPEGASPNAGAVDGINDWNAVGWRGPCPPIGTHRYFFKLYALDTMLTLDGGASKSDLEDAMRGHVLASATLVGIYQRKP